MVIETILGKMSDLKPNITRVDPLELTADLRTRPHFRRNSRSGTEIIVSLPRGETLEDGDVLTVTDGVAVVVQAAPEDLLSIHPRTVLEWGVTAYQLGNLHRDVRFLEDRMLSPYEESTEQVLQSTGVPYQRLMAPFAGARYGAYTGHAHSHSLTPTSQRHSHGAQANVTYDQV